MLEKLFKFLIDHDEEYNKSSIQLQLWKQKKKFLKTFLADYLSYLNVISSAHSGDSVSNGQTYFKDELNKNFQNIRAEDIRLPDFQNLSEISESQLNDFWVKLFKDDTAQIDYFKVILSTHYIELESIHPESIVLYLKLLIICYACLAQLVPFAITLRIDFFTTQLVWWCLTAIMEIKKIGINFDRTSKSTIKNGRERQKGCRR